MKQEPNIIKLLETNLRSFMSEEIDKEIKKATTNFKFILEQNKDHYIEHIMKNIRMFHTANNNVYEYTIEFINKKEKSNE